MKTTKASDILVQALEREGVRHVFGVPGEENLEVLESLRRSRIAFIPTRHEQGAGFMAATVGRLTGRPGVCLSTLGPGATNLMTAAAYAKLGGMPMVIITGQKPIKKSKQGSFQIVDVVDMFRPVTKMAKQIVHGSAVPAAVREAFRRAEEERPGPVHLELPEDVAAESAEEEPFSAVNARRPVAEEKAVAAAAEMIERAKRPLILIGAGANRKRTSKMLRAFIDATGIPFFNTQMGKGVVDERHPLFLGTAALSANDYIHCAIDRADLIVNVGHDIVEKPPFLMKRNGLRVIHVNFSPAQVDDIYFPQLEVVGDIANAVWQIMERVKPQAHWDFSSFLATKAELDRRIAREAKSAKFPVTPQRIVAEVGRAMPPGGVIALDNGMYKIWFSRNYKAAEPNSLLLDNALATMGAGLPSAIAACIVSPEKKVLAIAGDGGFMMSVQELETAVRLKLNLVVLIVNDGGFGMIRWKQDMMKLKPFGLSYGNPDFVQLAGSFGASGARAKLAGDVSRLIAAGFRHGGVRVIEAPVDYRENKRILTRRLARNTCDFLPNIH